MHLTAGEMEQKVVQWLTFGCHELGARVAARVALRTEARYLEPPDATDAAAAAAAAAAADSLQRVRLRWDLDASVSGPANSDCSFS